MAGRYKDDTFHMLDTFGKTTKMISGFNSTREGGQSVPLRGRSGNTWDAKHLTNFLNESNYSNWTQAGATFYSERSSKHKRYSSSGDHFFKTTKDNKNASLIGYTKVNPLVSIGKTTSHNKEVLKKHLNKQSSERYKQPKSPMRADGNFKFKGNQVKFRITDPLTLQHLSQKKPSGFEKERLKWLMSRRHPHGMTGVDHCQDPEATFYNKTDVDKIRVRVEPNTHNTFEIDREWKQKGRVSDDYKKNYGFPKGTLTQMRKFNNDDAHGFNIITNRFSARLK